MRRARRLIEEADRRLRQGEVSDAFLDRMGVGNADFRRFVTAWQRKLDAAAPGPAVTAPPGATRTVAPPTPGGILRPDGGPDARPVAGPVAVAADGRQGWVQGRQSPVSPQLRPAVEAYFEAVDRMAAEGRSGKAPQ
ncbi:MAG: hypothetical protein IMZ66_07700, partial [Planctomycetes bacterium]|nr:hypothetical protein [Planctomycetota bacterium]